MVMFCTAQRNLLEARNASCWCRLMEAAAWGCARWADSYLMPDEPASEGLKTAFGAKGGNGPHVVAVLLQVANTLLSQCVALPSCCPRHRQRP